MTQSVLLECLSAVCACQTSVAAKYERISPKKLFSASFCLLMSNGVQLPSEL